MMKPLPSHGRSNLPLVVAIVAIVVIVGLIIWINRNGDDPGPNGESEGPQERMRLYRMTQVANAYLEDENVLVAKDDQGRPIMGFVAADELLLELQEELPDEILPIQNLAIGRYLFGGLKLGEETEEQKEARRDRARQSIEDLIAADPDSPVGYWLRGKALQWNSSGRPSQETIDAFHEAAKRAAEDVGFQISLYEVAKLGTDEQVLIGDQALARAYELDPNNIAIALDLLVHQVEKENKQSAVTLNRLEDDVASIAKQRVLDNAINDPIRHFNDARAAIEEGNWRKAKTSVLFLRNLVKQSEGFRSAAARKEPHALEFMTHQLSAEFMAGLPERDLDSEAEAAQEIEFVPQAESIAAPQVRALKLADMDMDGDFEAIVLTDDSLVVYESAVPSAAVVCELALADALYDGILIADLDTDIRSEGGAGEPGTAQPPANPPEADTDVIAESSTGQCEEADADLVLWGPDGLLFVKNVLNRADDSRSLEIVPQDDAISSIVGVTAAVLVDIEHDADLDLVFATAEGLDILVHLGGKEVKSFLFGPYGKHSVMPEVSSPIRSLQVVDWDRDVDADIVCSDENGETTGWLENLRHGRFQWRNWESEWDEFSGRGRAVTLEADGNVSWDLVTQNESGFQIVLTQTSRAGVVKQKQTIEVESESFADFLLADFDNDGFVDLVGWNDEGMYAYRGLTSGGFASADWLESVDFAPRRVAAGDMDDDGDLDLVAVTSDSVKWLDNDGGNRNHWIVIRAVGQEDNAGRSNAHGIGSLVEIKSGRRYQAQTVAGQRNHFGLGQNAEVDVARTIWTNGMPQTIPKPEVDTAICQKMYLKGSCPFIYTWTGDKYEFLTDCLWAAPLGLQQAEGVLAPSRSWEYLKIPGERLVPAEGQYRIQLTEELWEAAYFDRVRLICVDHPADTEIFSNEKVGPPSIAQFKIHTVRQPRLPVSAKGTDGADVMDLIAARDDVYYRGFGERIRQGLTEPHFLELDLGKLDDPNQITLFLTGWIHPTDTSLNIAFSQSPELDGPRMPEVFVPDADGNWQPVPQPMGFPGGKTKTMTVDLSNAFLTDDYRVQIRTSGEIYWDAAFFTVDESPVETRLTKLNVAHADLHYRGFSMRFPIRRNTPERFDYSRVDTSPKWPPMRGNFTRYGDVTELLNAEDDCMAILASGDEMTVCFDVPSTDPPAGWKRDFILHCVGWDKDADLNTIYGQTVEPLPHQGMEVYPYPLDQAYPDTPAHRDYLRKYQTRQSDWSRFWRLTRALDAPSTP